MTWTKDGTISAAGKVDKASRPITFEEFGAIGDGIADDTVAVQDAIEALDITLGGNGVPASKIEMRYGASYLLSASIDVIQRAVDIAGASALGNPANFSPTPGKTSTFLWDGPAGVPMFHLKDTSRCKFSDVFLQGNVTNRPSEGIYNEGYVSQEGNHGLILDNVRFGSWGWTNPATPNGTPSMDYGVRYGGANVNNDQFSFRDVIFNNCGVGLALPNSQSIWGETQNILFENCGIGFQSSARHHGFNLNFQGCGKDVELHSTAYLDVEGWHSENSGLIFDLFDESGLSVRGGQWTVMSPMSGHAYFAQAAALANNLSLDGVAVVFNITAIPLKIRGTYSPTPYTIRIKGCKGLDSLALLDIQGYGQSDVTFLDIDTQGIKYNQSISAVPLSAPTLTKTANYTLSTADRTVIGNGTSITIKLPDPTNCPTGTPYRIKNINSTDLTVASAGTSKTVDGAASQTLPQWGTGAYVCDGTQWYSVSAPTVLPIDVDGTLSANSDAKVPSQKAVATFVASQIVGLADFRGFYNASTNLFPSTGGSGASGAVIKADYWICSVAGTLGGKAVTAGDLIMATADTPGQTAGNWGLQSHDIGYAPEDIANKSIDGTLAGNSDTLYPSQKATKTYADSKVIDSIAAADTTHAPSRKAVFDALTLMAPLASPGLTGNPTAPTPTPGDNDTSIANTAFVTAADVVAVAAAAVAANLAMPPRYRKYVSGRYYGVEGTYVPGQVSFGDGFFTVVPFWVHDNITALTIGGEVVIAAGAGTIRFGIYGSNASDQPSGAPILDAGTVSATTTGVKEITISQAMTPGLYWLGVGAQGGAPTLRTIGNGGQAPVAPVSLNNFGSGSTSSNSYYMTGVSGALPTWAGLNDNASGYRVMVKV